MKRILTLALAALPFIALPQMVQPANAQLTIQLGGNRSRRPVYVAPARRRVFVPQRRVVQQRRVWIPGRWENRREREQYRRVWTPGYYRY